MIHDAYMASKEALRKEIADLRSQDPKANKRRISFLLDVLTAKNLGYELRDYDEIEVTPASALLDPDDDGLPFN